MSLRTTDPHSRTKGRWRDAARLSAAVLAAASAISLAGAQETTRRIAFTFDDIPRGDGPVFSGSERAETLIAALESAGIEGAMFFAQTNFIERRSDGRERLLRYQEGGHVLANHSHSHPALSRVGADAFLADIDQAIDELRAFTDVAAYFRFPFLDEGSAGVELRDAVRAGLAARGLRNGYVTIDNYDWFMASLLTEAFDQGHEPDLDVACEVYTEVLLRNVEHYDAMANKVLGRSPAHVLLLHENDLAALCVDDLGRELTSGGWQIISALEAFADPIAEQEPDTLVLGQGRIGALAHVAGWTPADLRHESEDEEYLRALFVRRGLLP